ncbi:riboflavin kinase [Candidatus Kaiserbacteria bacterium]|nr:riboflavin kinase [Candidatus Kaiserbacteria bacterium]
METFSGTVQKGTKRAAALGFPTVNIPLDDSAVSGIYAAQVVVGGKSYDAAAFADQTRSVLEAHILDTDLDLYGKEITVELLKKIRDNKEFEDDDALRTAIADDVAKVRTYFSESV